MAYRSHDRVQAAQTSKLSVVIPSMGRVSLATLINSLERHGADWISEIIVVFDPAFLPDEDTALQGSGVLPVSCVAAPGPGVNRARNHGADLARSSLLAFLDDDVEVQSADFFEEVFRLFEQPRVVAVGGGYDSFPGTDWLGRGYNALCSVWRASAGGGTSAMLLGGCMVVRRAAWQAVGRFDDRILYGGSETPFICVLRATTGDVIYSRMLHVVHRSSGRGIRHWLRVAFCQGQTKNRTKGHLPPRLQRWRNAALAVGRLPLVELVAFLVFTPLFLLSSRLSSLAGALRSES